MAELGAIERGIVIRVMPYGALVRLDEGGVGLIHISELDDKYVNDVREVVSEGARVTVKVIGVKNERYEFSIKKLPLEEREVESVAPMEESEFESMPFHAAPFSGTGAREGGREAFDSKMRDFLLDSSERLNDVKKHHEGKLGMRKR
jgi:S1 RNA binding domain protein